MQEPRLPIPEIVLSLILSLTFAFLIFFTCSKMHDKAMAEVKNEYQDLLIIEKDVFSKDSVISLQNELDIICCPCCVERMIESGWHIILTSSVKTAKTDVEEKNIYINSSIEAIVDNTLYEIGHFVDNRFQNASTSAEFIKMYEEEKSSFQSTRRTDEPLDSTDYFCRVFEEMGVNKTKSLKSAPKSTRYIAELMGIVIKD